MKSSVRWATSTNLVSFNPDGTKCEMRRLIPLYARVGFTVLDLNFCEMMNPGSPLSGSRAKEYLESLKQMREKYSLIYNQSHAPYDYSFENRKMDPLILKALEHNSELEIPVAVLHPLPGSIEQNADYLYPFIKRAYELGVNVAVENMESRNEIQRAEDLKALLEMLNMKNTGVCLDTGHAHLAGLDVAEEVLKYGPLLLATHIADNDRTGDQHLLPFNGTIEWEPVMKAFNRSGYTGYFTLECMKEHQNIGSLPEKEEAASHSLAVCRKLTALLS